MQARDYFSKTTLPAFCGSLRMIAVLALALLVSDFTAVAGIRSAQAARPKVIDNLLARAVAPVDHYSSNVDNEVSLSSEVRAENAARWLIRQGGVFHALDNKDLTHALRQTVYKNEEHFSVRTAKIIADARRGFTLTIQNIRRHMVGGRYYLLQLEVFDPDAGKINMHTNDIVLQMFRNTSVAGDIQVPVQSMQIQPTMGGALHHLQTNLYIPIDKDVKQAVSSLQVILRGILAGADEPAETSQQARIGPKDNLRSYVNQIAGNVVRIKNLKFEEPLLLGQLEIYIAQNFGMMLDHRSVAEALIRLNGKKQIVEYLLDEIKQQVSAHELATGLAEGTHRITAVAFEPICESLLLD